MPDQKIFKKKKRKNSKNLKFLPQKTSECPRKFSEK